MSQISHATSIIRNLTTSLPELTDTTLETLPTLPISRTYIVTTNVTISKSVCNGNLTIYIMPEASLTVDNIMLTSGNLNLICMGLLIFSGTTSDKEEEIKNSKLAGGKLKLICSGSFKVRNNLYVTPDSVLDLSTAQDIVMYEGGALLTLGKNAKLIFQDNKVSTSLIGFSAGGNLEGGPDNPTIPDPNDPVKPNPGFPINPDPINPDDNPEVNPDLPLIPVDPNPTLSNILSQPSIKIIGDESKLVAPPVQVFDEKISVEGTWAIDCAYPQWFSSDILFSSAKEARNATTRPDWAPAINKAIKIINSGLVSLPRGVYTIKSTIFTHLGIRLVGEGAADRQVLIDEDDSNSDVVFEATGTVLMADVADRSKFATGNYRVKWDTKDANPKNHTFKLDKDSKEPYMMAINFESEYSVIRNSSSNQGQPSNILFTSAPTPAIIEYIYFTTTRDTSKQIPANEEINAIYAIGYLSLRNLMFVGIGTALFIHPQYSDCQELIDCQYRRPWQFPAMIEKSPEEVDRFAICRLGNGDAFRMEGCHIIGHSTIGSLYLNKCYGGSLVNNIYNSHVVINGCLNTVYSGNHAEYGAQLMVICSTVDASANYFEKGLYPSILLRGNDFQDFSILNLSTSKFIFSDGPRYETEKKDASSVWSNNIKSRIENINQHDIEIDKNSTLSLNQNYRNMQLFGGGFSEVSIGKSHTYGILLGLTNYVTKDGVIKQDIDDFEWYDSRSGFLTPGCQIARNTVIANYSQIPSAGGTVSYHKNNNQYALPAQTDQIPWLIGYYGSSVKYGFKLLAPGESVQQHGNLDLLGDGITLVQPSTANPKAGVYLNLAVSESANRGNLYIERVIYNIESGKEVIKKKDYVYIPLCFTSLLYDNGVTLSSFKWESFQ